MREIPLTQGKVALVDDADYEWLMQWRWCARYSPTAHTWYAMRGISDAGRVRGIKMHRLIMDAPDGMDVDHKDHDGLHNWRGNLRVCTRGQNMANGRRSANNTSGYKGVWRHRKRWESCIRVDGKHVYLGCFSSSIEAAQAYDKAAVQYFGDFALLNVGNK